MKCEHCDEPADWVISWGLDRPGAGTPLRREAVCRDHLHQAFDLGIDHLPEGRRFWVDRARNRTAAP